MTVGIIRIKPPPRGRGFDSIPFENRDFEPFTVELQGYAFFLFKDENSLRLTFCAERMGQRPGLMKHIHDGIRMVVRRDAVDRQGPALTALVDKHQLASGIQPVLVPALLHGQADGFHLPLASRQSIACDEEVEME